MITMRFPAGAEKRVVTVDGIEETYQANYLGHFLLTNLMLPLLKKSTKARIVNVTSLVYLLGWVSTSRLSEQVSQVI